MSEKLSNAWTACGDKKKHPQHPCEQCDDRDSCPPGHNVCPWEKEHADSYEEACHNRLNALAGLEAERARNQQLEADNARLREGLEKIQASPIGYGDTFNGSVEMGGRPTCPECIEKVRAAEEALSRTPAQALERRAKVELKRIKTRVSGGVCPCCNRTFQNLARHMKTKHPEGVQK